MVAVVFAALLFWACLFAIYFAAQGISPIELFLGALEPYDSRLGQWQTTGSDPQSGLTREQRLLLPDDRQRSPYLVRQVRYRDATTAEIVRIEPPGRVPRRRTGVKVSRYESGSRTPSLETGLAYEAALGVPVCTLFRGRYEEIAERVAMRRRKLEAETEKRQRVGSTSRHAA